MKVERYYLDKDGTVPQTVIMRVMDTTCPKCKQHVMFTLQDEEFLGDENEFLVKENERLRREIQRLNSIIDRFATMQHPKPTTREG